jgi:O-antigen ligase
MLFLRPQEQVGALAYLHLAEVAALIALAAMAAGRLRRGLPVSKVTPELVAVVGLGVVILFTAPFSIWPGGAVGTFTELYVKVLLIFVLMLNTLTTPARLRQFVWLLVLATAYIAFRAVFDYARGVNLIEYGRVQGAVGGMFKNPNDLALNMVAVLPLAAMLAARRTTAFRRAAAGICIVLIVGAIVASQSRSGTVGLVLMGLVLAAGLLRRRPGLVGGALLVALMALPALPASYWQRIASIADEDKDQTGSREARQILLRESWQAFLAHPLTGVGAGQFKNYNPEQREEAWRESHNVVLQVAAELGIAGLALWGFLVARAAAAPFQTRRLLRRANRRTAGPRDAAPPLAPGEYDELHMYSVALQAAVAGWFVCALFASVGYHWTFYYLLALAIAPRQILLERAAAVRAARRRTAPAPVAVGANA